MSPSTTFLAKFLGPYCITTECGSQSMAERYPLVIVQEALLQVCDSLAVMP